MGVARVHIGGGEGFIGAGGRQRASWRRGGSDDGGHDTEQLGAAGKEANFAENPLGFLLGCVGLSPSGERERGDGLLARGRERELFSFFPKFVFYFVFKFLLLFEIALKI
jgi:hypothetical protein